MEPTPNAPPARLQPETRELSRVTAERAGEMSCWENGSGEIGPISATLVPPGVGRNVPLRGCGTSWLGGRVPQHNRGQPIVEPQGTRLPSPPPDTSPSSTRSDPWRVDDFATWR